MMYEIVRHENQTHDPLISSLDALYSELLESLGRAGSKFNYNYTSHINNKMHCDKKKKELKIKVLKKFCYWLLAAVMVSSSNMHAVETKGNTGIMLYEGY